MLTSEEKSRLELMSQYEQQKLHLGFCQIAGVDEAGRGPLAGPVVAAACILPKNTLITGLNDSKLLTPTKRKNLFTQITKCSLYGIGVVDAKEIDRINILQATFLAMRIAIENLSQKPDFLLIDGNHSPGVDIPLELIVEGDKKSISIAAASIIAKVTRDKLMDQYHLEYPEYGFDAHKGYGTKRHLEAIQKFGPSPIHRVSFAPVRLELAKDAQLSFSFS